MWRDLATDKFDAAARFEGCPTNSRGTARTTLAVLIALLLFAVPAIAATITGSNANDTLHGTPQADSIDAGNGNDTVHADDGDDAVQGGNGNDDLHGEGGHDRLLDSNGDDELVGGSGDDELDGGNGTDLLDAGPGHDTLDGGNGNESLIGGAGNDDAVGGNGNDTFSAGTGHDTFDGDLGNDSAAGDAGLDLLYADAGNDQLSGQADSDALIGLATSGSPTLDGGTSKDVLAGGRGTLRGSEGDDVIFGYGNAVIDGGAGTDTCYRSAGVSTTNCETLVALGTSSATPVLAVLSGPAEGSTVTSASASFTFSATNARGVWCVTSTGIVAECSSGTFTVSGLTEGDHAVAFIAPANGAKPASVGLRRFTVQLPPTGPAIDSASSPHADTLALTTRNLASVHRFRARFEDGGVASWLSNDPRVTVDPSLGAPTSTVQIVDPNLGRETVVRVELLNAGGAVLAEREIDVEVATSVALSEAASNSPSSLAISGENLDVLDRIVLVHSTGNLTINVTDSGVTVSPGQIIITSTALDGLAISQIDAVLAVDGEEVLASLHVNITIASADTTPPAIETPGEIEAEATSANGAEVTYEITAIDATDGPVAATCTPESGSTFPIGESEVECSAVDAADNSATETFVVRVRDTTGPWLSLPENPVVQTPDPDGAIVEYESTATDAVDGTVSVACAPPSGSRFTVGTTLVTCSATDTRDNTSSAMGRP